MTDLSRMEGVQEKLERFRRDFVPDEPPTENARFLFNNVPVARNNPQVLW